MIEKVVTELEPSNLPNVAAERNIEQRWEASYYGMDERTAREWARLDAQDFARIRDDELARFAATTITDNFQNPTYKAEFELAGAEVLASVAERNAANETLIAAKAERKEREHAAMLAASEERAKRWTPEQASQRAQSDVAELLALTAPQGLSGSSRCYEAAMLQPQEVRRPTIAPADKQLAEALRLVRIADSFPTRRFQEGVLDASADQVLGFRVPSDWTGRVQTKGVIERDGQVQWAEGAGVELQFFGVYAHMPDNTFQWLADVPKQRQADELADRLAVIDAYAIDNEHEQAVAFVRIHEERAVRRERGYRVADIAMFAAVNPAYREALEQAAPDVAAELTREVAVVSSAKVISGTFVGKVTALSDDHVEQKIGRDPRNVMVHDRKALSGDDVSVGHVVTVSYEMGKGRLRNHDLTVEQRGMGR